MSALSPSHTLTRERLKLPPASEDSWLVTVKADGCCAGGQLLVKELLMTQQSGSVK